MLSPATLDCINAAFEACGFFPTLFEAWVLFRRKSAAGMSLVTHAYWTVVGFWWLFYYSNLDQPWTVFSVGLWFAAYGLNTVLILRYQA